MKPQATSEPDTIRTALLAAIAVSLVLFANLLTVPSFAWAASEADEACRDWYGQQEPEEQSREDNEAQVASDVDGDGCTGILAPPDSDGPVEVALEEGGVENPQQAGGSGGEDGSGEEELAQAGGSDAAAPPDDAGQPGADEEQPEDCAARFAAEDPEEQAREREEDMQFGVDNDDDGCIAEESAEDATDLTGASTEAPEASAAPSGDGGLAGMVLGFFTSILEWMWDNTFGFALEEMSGAFEANALSLPELEGRSDLLGLYTQGVEKLRPAILVGVLLLGILLMVRGDNYDLAYAGFHGLPKLLGVGMAMAFLPQFMGELSRITAGIAGAFFPSGGDIDTAGQELFKAAVGNLAVTNFLNIILLVAAAAVGMLVIVVALLKNILYVILFIAGPFALVASLVPGLSSLAGSWFRGVMACAAIPALWSLELGIGTFVVNSPEAVFGGQTNALGFISNGAVTSLGAILTMWIMYKTPFKVIEWAFNVQLPGRGGLGGLAKTAATLAVMVPAKTAVATAVKGAMDRSSSGGGGKTDIGKADAGKSDEGKPRNSMPGKASDGGGGKQQSPARQIEQARNQGQQSRRGENVSRSTHKFLKQMDARNEGKEAFMQRRSRGTGGIGTHNDPSRDLSERKG